MREAGLDRMAALSLGRPAGQLAELPEEMLQFVNERSSLRGVSSSSGFPLPE